MGYLQFETAPKALTRESDRGRGQVSLQHLNPALFLQTQLIKLHTHEGSDSRSLKAGATPEMVKGYQPREREEHGTATWTGSAAASGSVVLTYAVPFLEAPDLFCLNQTSVNIQVSTNTPTTTTVTIYWKDDTSATHTSVVIAWLAKGR